MLYPSKSNVLTNAIRARPALDRGRDGRHNVLGRLLVHIRSPVLVVMLGVEGGACLVALAQDSLGCLGGGREREV